MLRQQQKEHDDHECHHCRAFFVSSQLPQMSCPTYITWLHTIGQSVKSLSTSIVFLVRLTTEIFLTGNNFDQRNPDG